MRHALLWRLGIALLAGTLGAASSAEDAADPGRSRAAGAQEAARPTWYAQALARGEAGLNVTHFWSKGSMLRAETVISGHKIVTVVNGAWYYAFDALSRRGMAIRREAAAVARDAPGRRPFGDEYALLVEQGAEQVGEQTLLGRPAGIFRVTDRHGRRELWVTLDAERLPLRLEIFDRKTGEKRYTDYLNWRSGLEIPEAFFEPEAGIALERMDFQDYVRRSVEEGPLGPVPVLYAHLLYVKGSE
ncbi:MAG: hypothetical protein OEY15_10500 [Myxococcales bacterium]|nr:hypothetical protein [Myxococcales bacterium]